MKTTFFLSVIIFITSCSNPKENTDIKLNEREKPSKKLIDMFMKDYNDAADLFSIKYNISQNNANIIIQEYIRTYDPVLNSIITGKNNEEIGKKILNQSESLRDFTLRMNQVTGEESVKISSFVIDLKIYMKIMEIDN